MKTNETQYDICEDHAESLLENIGRLIMALNAYKEADHNIEHLNSPFMLAMNEDLFDLNVRVERLIQRIDPSYAGEYTADL